MSKCQKNKYAAGGKCGSMGSSDGKNNPEQVGCKPLATFGEINGNLAALLASREKQDLLFSTQSQPKVPISQAIIVKKTIAKSDIDIVLEGDF
jgi:hypothetical protein